MPQIRYAVGEHIELDAFIDLLRSSTLGERRPLDDATVMQAMLDHGQLIVSAWDDETLIATTLTDYHRVAYLADLVVHRDYQRQGIGKALIDRTRDALEPTCMIILLAAPKANDYYQPLGFEHNPRAWMLHPKNQSHRIVD